jgi:DNA polymerase (family 10)
MSVSNYEIAEVFSEIADLLEFQDENPFRVRAYRNAARTIGESARSLAEMVERGEDLSELPGIGKDLAGKVAEIVRTGKLGQLVDLERKVPAGLRILRKIQGLGPKRIALLHKSLGISTAEDLKKAVASGRVREIKGFGPKIEAQILAEIGGLGAEPKRFKWAAAEQMVEPIVAELRKTAGVRDVVVAGSFRRRKETVGDLDILATEKDGARITERFVRYPEVRKVLSQGPGRATVILKSGIQVDLRVVPPESFGAALAYFTGSKPHVIAVRTLGVRRRLKINEYGVFRGKKRIAGRTEAEVFSQVGLPYIEPELRENQGEIEAAQKGRLPSLVAVEDIRGDLHAHTKATDGRATLEEMVAAARKRGYAYLAVTDHSQRVTMVHGLTAARLRQQNAAIDRLNAKSGGFLVLKSIELDILEDGGLDLPNDVLEELDLVVGSVHSKFGLSEEKQTERIIRAMGNPRVHVLGHPTGRLIGERRPYAVNMEKLMAAAKKDGWALELNAHPDRLDLTDADCRLAKEIGVTVVISTDAHSVDDLGFMRFGVAQARRGWLEARDVANTRSWQDLRSLLSRRRG